MRRAASVAALVLLGMSMSVDVSACDDAAEALGVSRIVEIDASAGPIFGSLTGRARETRFLAPKEVVLTFDDGPIPRLTPSILDTLDRFCTKATFFSVGRMAVAYPALTREIMARGHTLGAHTWSHPSLPRLGLERARAQIDSGFAAVTLAAGRPIAPFFRFPGLRDSPALLEHLQKRGVAAFTVDVVSNDSFIADPGRLFAHTFERLQAQNGGILLFHDIKRVTARALPRILAQLKARGYSVVHLRAKAPYVPPEGDLAAVSALTRRGARGSNLIAITGEIEAAREAAPTAREQPGASPGDPPVTLIAPTARDRTAEARRSDPSAAARSSRHGRGGVAAVLRSRSTAGASAAAKSGASTQWLQTFRRRMHGSGG